MAMSEITTATQAATAPATTSGSTFKPFGDDGFSFYDFLDIINPLQHIPVISTIYREMTEDKLDPGSRIAGGTLFGGPIGLVASIANVVVEEETGKDMGGHVWAALQGEESQDPGPTVTVAAASQTDTSVLAQQASLYPAGWPLQRTGPDASRQTTQPRSETQLADTSVGDIEWFPPSDQANATPFLDPSGGTPAAAPNPVEQQAVIAADPEQVAIVQSALQEAEKQATIFQVMTAQNATQPRPAPSSREAVQKTSVPDGATANEGGWFASTMLSALKSYESGGGTLPATPQNAFSGTF